MQKEYLVLLSILVGLFAGLFLIFKGRNKRIRTYFLLFSLAVTSWSLSLYFYFNQSFWEPISWVKIVSLLTFANIASLLWLVLAVSKKKLKDGKTFLLVFLVFLGIVISSPIAIDYIFRSFTLPATFVAFFLLFFSYVAWVIIILFEQTLNNDEKDRLRTIPVLFAFGMFITTVMVTNVFIPLIFDSSMFFWFVPIFSSLLVLFTAFVASPYFFSQKTKILILKIAVGTIGIFLLLSPFFAIRSNFKFLVAFFFILFCFLVNSLVRTRSEKEAEAERIAAEWEKLNLSKDQFILSFQHHLRTPLVPIKGYLEMILSGSYGREENPLIRERLIDIKTRVELLSSLIEGLLDVQEARAGRKKLTIEKCQVNNLIESVIEELTIESEEKKLYLKFEKGALPEIKADKEKIKVAIWNVVDNAIKYTNNGGVTITSKVKDDKIKISVSDTGIGMNKEEVERFLKGDLFERGEDAKKLYGPGRGVGLGLSIEFIKSHNGKIWAESGGKGKGTTFWIEIPIDTTKLT